jgi:hypothetical protein
MMLQVHSLASFVIVQAQPVDSVDCFSHGVL